MYKVLKPLGGYGYLVGDVTIHIAEKDIPKFLENKSIEKVAQKAPEDPKPSKPPRKRNSKE